MDLRLEATHDSSAMDPTGPFITVVSVDGGNHCGNKLTVITPTEVHEVLPSPNYSETDTVSVSGSVSHGNECMDSPSESQESDEENAAMLDGPGGAAYVTVVALGKPALCGASKSIVNIFNEIEDAFSNIESENMEFEFQTDVAEQSSSFQEEYEALEDLRKMQITPLPRRRQKSIVAIEKALPDITENVVVYRLPGERLGFGLRFEGGTLDPHEKVKRLFIQSCADESPAQRTTTSWGPLVEGDEILGIEGTPVSTMSRIDCIQCLKEASVAINLSIRHYWTAAEMKMSTRARVLEHNGSFEDESERCNNNFTQDQFASSTMADQPTEFYGHVTIHPQPHPQSEQFSDDLNNFNESETESEDEESLTSLEVMNCENKGHALILPIGGIASDVSSPFEETLEQQELDAREIPRAPPRKINGIGILQNSQNAPSKYVIDNNAKLKPPLGFDDVDADEYQNASNGMNERPLSICDSTFSSSADMEEIDGDGTASTRSTVISRLSTASSLATFSHENLLSPQSFLQQVQFYSAEALNGFPSGMPQLSGMGRAAGPGYSGLVQKDANLAMSPEASESPRRSGPGPLPRDMEIPLSPPLSFKDLDLWDGKLEIDPEPVLRSRSRVNIVHPYEDYYGGGRESSAALQINQNVTDSPNDIIHSHCLAYEERDDELANFAQELGQEDTEFLDEVDTSLCMEAPDAEVMIRIEWLHEIEEEVQPLQTNPFHLVHVHSMDSYNREMIAETDEDFFRILDSGENDEIYDQTENHAFSLQSHYNDEENNSGNYMNGSVDRKPNGLDSESYCSREAEEATNQGFVQDEIVNNIDRQDALISAQYAVDETVSDLLASKEECDRKENVNEPVVMKRSNGMSPESRDIPSPENPAEFFDEKVKVIQVHVKKLQPQETSNEQHQQTHNGTGGHNQDSTVSSAECLLETQPDPPLAVRRKQQRKRTLKEMSVELPGCDKNRAEDVDSSGDTLENENAPLVQTGANDSIGLTQVDHLERKMMNQILVVRPRPVATIQLDRSPTIVPVTMAHDFKGTAEADTKEAWKLQPAKENKFLSGNGKAGYSHELEGTGKQAHDDGAPHEPAELNSDADHVHFISSSAGADLTVGKKTIEFKSGLSLTPTRYADFGTDANTATSQQISVKTQLPGSSGDGAEVRIPIEVESRETEGMDSSSEILHQFIPPTFSRLPPDGDEFPKSWNDERSSQSKTYRSELNLKEMMVLGTPPPVPMSELPSEEDSSPPPLPASVPPLPPTRPNLARRTSIEDRKRLFEASPRQSPKFPMAPPSRAHEPSKKSVKDKIAMFSTRSSSSEDSPDSSTLPPSAPILHNNSKPTSLPMRTTNGNATNNISKSSDNLLSNVEMTLSSQDYETGATNGSNLWKSNKSTTDLRGTGTGLTRKYSVNEEPQSRIRDSSTGSNLGERSQSMIDVADDPHKSSYQMSYKYNSLTKTTYSNPKSNAAATLMEQRRKCMTKLRGLVIPDKPESVSTSVSVVDLPTIISKDAVVTSAGQFTQGSIPRQPASRTDSIDGMSSSDDTSAKLDNNLRNNGHVPVQAEIADWKFPNVLPKYSPAFKRRSLTAYQPTSTTKNTKVSINYKPSTALEPKSLESLTSPKSDSSFEYLAPFTVNSEPKIVAITTVSSLSAKRNSFELAKQTEQPPKNESNEPAKFSPKTGKLEDSDNDSAVSSSRSSISHELSPPNSPTPGESSSTPDPDLSLQHNEDRREENTGEEDSANNSDEGWRILKAQSVEAINRKNVLTSAKFSSGGGLGGRSDDGSTSSGNRRRSDDEEASYADAETEDTESSCSELEVSKSRRRPPAAGRVSHHQHAQRRLSQTTHDTEEDEEPEPQTPPSHSKEPSMDFGDIEFGELTESPLQAIFDMEAKMAYINEICDALPARGETSSRYFNRRDSQATVIERPIERKLSAPVCDQVDSAADRRARNRSSSGNESDFSSSISIASQNQNVSTKPIVAPIRTSDWAPLEKKHSKSLTAVNLLSKQAEAKLIPSTSVAAIPKAVTGGLVEMKIERIIEKTTVTDSISKSKVTGGPTIPRGRNDFKSLSQKWQQISNTEASKPLAPAPTSTFAPTSKHFSEKLTSPVQHTKLDSDVYARRNVGMGAAVAAAAAAEADQAWAERRRLENPRSEPQTTSMASTKRSVSVNDIRKAFEKAEHAVNSYGRDENNGLNVSQPRSDSGNILSPPSAHFRVSSFDSTTSEDSSATTPAGIYGSVSSLLASAPRDPYGSITSLASSTSLISPQELQQLIDEANQSLEEAGTPSHEVSVVILHREFAGGSLGITLAGGADYETKEITVHKVLTGSIADRDGRVHRGDRVLSINGKNTKGLTHREALNLLKAPRTEVVLVVSRGRSGSNGFQTIEETSATLDRAVEPLLNGSLASLLENDEDTSYRWGPMKTVILIKDGAGLGFSLDGGKGSIAGDKPLTVKKIFVGGPAEKSGELKVGDLITSINDSNMSSKSRTEAWNFMKKLGDGGVKLSIRSPLSY